jgi:uncharacterized protein (TIGR02145 family)
MRTVSQQIGWSQEAKLLYEIQRELDYLYNATWIAAGNTTTTTTTIFVCTGADVIIGTQTWKVCNLDVTTYRNGDVIPQVTDPTEWANLTTGAWCWLNNNSANNLYGKLYNWYAITDPRGIGPEGYHVPSDEELSILRTYLGGAELAGGPLKEAGTSHWNSPNEGATNSSGFTALPGALRESNGSFNNIGISNILFSSTEYDTTSSWAYILQNVDSSMPRGNFVKKGGFSVRLIKD